MISIDDYLMTPRTWPERLVASRGDHPAILGLLVKILLGWLGSFAFWLKDVLGIVQNAGVQLGFEWIMSKVVIRAAFPVHATP